MAFIGRDAEIDALSRWLPDASAAHRHRTDNLEGAMTHGLDRAYWHLPRDVARVYRRLGLLPLPEADTALTAAISNLPTEEAHQALHVLSAARLLEDVADHPVRDRVHQLHDAARAHAQARHEDTGGSSDLPVQGTTTVAAPEGHVEVWRAMRDAGNAFRQVACRNRRQAWKPGPRRSGARVHGIL
ncbi:hypothetical protein [Streptomyces sp. NPDC020667]|uniref:hypothetical protein n=1 Tax=Streptomyces sp. NPDC020667 TaxID=3154895 RepID=UPI003402CA06